jgi:enterochelin esterase family protein
MMPAVTTLMIQSQPSSPRLATLRQRLRTAGGAALDTFWQEVRGQGTPLIEPVPDDDRHVLVTFLWRGLDVESIVILSPALSLIPSQNCMRRLQNTDLWYKSYVLPSELHFTYRLSINDPLASAPRLTREQAAARSVVGQADVLNAVPLATQVGTTTWTSSLVSLPEAPIYPWSAPQPAAPAGSVEEFTLFSAHLQNERRVWIYTPPQYVSNGEPFGLLVLFDGEAYRCGVPTATILDNLIATAEIAPMVVVMVGCIDIGTRTRELACHDPFVDFVGDELMPWVHQQVHVSQDRIRTTVGGASLGGLTAAFVALRRPELFGSVLSQSGSFWWSVEDEEWLTRQYLDAPKLPVRFYLEAGLLENRRVPGREGASLLVANRHLRDVLKAKGYTVHYTEFVGGHDFACWRGTLADGLRVVGRWANTRSR